MCEIGSLNLVADVQSIVMEACRERGREKGRGETWEEEVG